jgi:hypothetical protein
MMLAIGSFVSLRSHGLRRSLMGAVPQSTWSERSCDMLLRKGFTGSLAVLLFLFCSPLLYSQSIRGNMTGTVFDPGHSLIPGANVTVVHVATGAQRRAATDGRGEFVS